MARPAKKRKKFPGFHPGRCCAKTGKARYRDQAEAEFFLRYYQTRKDDWRKGPPKRCYPCEFCKGWHLTSMEIAPTNETGGTP